MNRDPGIFLILFALVCTWASDSFAYLAGRSLGKHKMAPHISPNKTVEGLIGGALGCVVLGLALAFGFKYDMTHAFFLSVMAAVMAPVGTFSSPTSSGPATLRIPEIFCPATAA